MALQQEPIRNAVILTGAGISAESGLQTFRGGGGLWEGVRPEEIASIEAWERDPDAVLRFYNQRRAQVRAAEPNAAHRALARLCREIPATIVTQNVDDLHERAGAFPVLHLHGEILKARSSLDPLYRIDLKDADIHPGDRCPQGGQLRPDVVWFGEAVPAMTEAAGLVAEADLFAVIGTSLQVYPAAGLLDLVPDGCRCVAIDPSIPDAARFAGFECHARSACEGVPPWVEQILAGMSCAANPSRIQNPKFKG